MSVERKFICKISSIYAHDYPIIAADVGNNWLIINKSKDSKSFNSRGANIIDFLKYLSRCGCTINSVTKYLAIAVNELQFGDTIVRQFHVHQFTLFGLKLNQPVINEKNCICRGSI